MKIPEKGKELLPSLGAALLVILIQGFVLSCTQTNFVFMLSLVPIVLASLTGDNRNLVFTALFTGLGGFVLIWLKIPDREFMLLHFGATVLLFTGTGFLTSKPVKLSFNYKKELAKREQAEKLLIEEKQKLNIILLSITDGIISTDENKKITFMNYEAERLTGYNLKEAAGKSIEEIYEIYSEETGERITDPLDRIVGRGKIVGLANHTILRSKTRREIIIGDCGSPIKNEDRNIIGFIISFRDVGYKKEFQTKLNAAKAQVIEAERLAGIGQLAAGIAHEINNPMGFIQSNMETLALFVTKVKELIDMYRQEKNREKIEAYEQDFGIDYVLSELDNIIEENKTGMERISRIVKTLKDFAKVNNQAEWSRGNLNKVIEDALLIVRNETKYHAEIILELQEDLPSTTFNAGEMNQVILNLIMNAIQAIKEKIKNKKGLLSISTSVENQYILCQISDNGGGIPPNQLTRIFDPFFTTKDPGKGSGLGLHIVYNIVVKKHKGDIMVRNNDVGGALFTIKLPIVQ